MSEEFRFHVGMESERLTREQGLESREARRRALVAAGGVDQRADGLPKGCSGFSDCADGSGSR